IIGKKEVDLLKWAAKAAGVEVRWNAIAKEFELTCGGGAVHIGWWNTLMDDGDALQLAVRLKLDILFTDSLVDCGIPICLDDAPFAATRLAIVRAAAELAKKG